jgi:hypothetical protein
METNHMSDLRRADAKMPKAVVPETWIDYAKLEPHPLANKLPMIKPEKFEELRKDIDRHGLEQRLILFAGNPDGTVGALRLLDGRNRHKALKALDKKITSEMVEVFEGTYEDAKAKVFSLNYNRRQLSAKEQRDVIKGEIAEKIGEAPPSGYTAKQLDVEREIARIVGCSHNTVGSVIEELRDPPELKKYRQWLKVWKKELTDDQQKMFVRDEARNLRYMLQEIGGLVNVTS